eukprot:jgi/Tetstr1/425453/TSEL_015900.t1
MCAVSWLSFREKVLAQCGQHTSFVPSDMGTLSGATARSALACEAGDGRPYEALDELLPPYIPVANQYITLYLARARNHDEAIDNAFRFRLNFLWRLNEIK